MGDKEKHKHIKSKKDMPEGINLKGKHGKHAVKGKGKNTKLVKGKGGKKSALIQVQNPVISLAKIAKTHHNPQANSEKTAIIADITEDAIRSAEAEVSKLV